eukprot:TRINITY_DN4669_c0_g1_i1.p1 TRINITY_DN4669_c0_g1~~TRINITY_DN4669_c0_g1_i1.p1  ORF type:complete len:691 (-),score=151.57 TRINITY_DN4669_c0_g1_i1:77-2149(-)
MDSVDGFRIPAPLRSIWEAPAAPPTPEVPRKRTDGTQRLMPLKRTGASPPPTIDEPFEAAALSKNLVPLPGRNAMTRGTLPPEPRTAANAMKQENRGELISKIAEFERRLEEQAQKMEARIRDEQRQNVGEKRAKQLESRVQLLEKQVMQQRRLTEDAVQQQEQLLEAENVTRRAMEKQQATHWALLCETHEEELLELQAKRVRRISEMAGAKDSSDLERALRRITNIEAFQRSTAEEEEESEWQHRLEMYNRLIDVVHALAAVIAEEHQNRKAIVQHSNDIWRVIDSALLEQSAVYICAEQESKVRQGIAALEDEEFAEYFNVFDSTLAQLRQRDLLRRVQREERVAAIQELLTDLVESETRTRELVGQALWINYNGVLPSLVVEQERAYRAALVHLQLLAFEGTQMLRWTVESTTAFQDAQRASEAEFERKVRVLQRFARMCLAKWKLEDQKGKQWLHEAEETRRWSIIQDEYVQRDLLVLEIRDMRHSPIPGRRFTVSADQDDEPPRILPRMASLVDVEGALLVLEVSEYEAREGHLRQEKLERQQLYFELDQMLLASHLSFRVTRSMESVPPIYAPRDASARNHSENSSLRSSVSAVTLREHSDSMAFDDRMLSIFLEEEEDRELTDNRETLERIAIMDGFDCLREISLGQNVTTQINDWDETSCSMIKAGPSLHQLNKAKQQAWS